MPTVLVTGANGFIGSHLVRLLLKKGYAVRALVRPTSDVRSLDGLNVTVYVGDVREPDSLVRPVTGVNYIYHLAAMLMTTSRREFIETNATGTRHLLEAAAGHAAETLQRFLLVSSQAALGPGIDTTPFDERSPMNPISWYGESKRDAEAIAMSFADRLPVTVVRPPLVYGPRDTDVSQIYPVIEHRIHPKLGFRAKYLVAVFVEDLVNGMVGAAEHPQTVSQTYFLNNNELITGFGLVRTVAEAMEKRFGVPLPAPLLALRLAAPLVEFGYHFTRSRPKLTRDKAREVCQRFWVADASKAERDFGWRAEHSLLDGMRQTIPYYRRKTREEKGMARESGIIRWLKFMVCAAGIGGLMEMCSAAADLYRYITPWAVWIIVFGGFGLVLGTLAHWLRRTPALLQGIVGMVLVGTCEILNHHHLIDIVGWRFNPDQFIAGLHPLITAVLVGLVGTVVMVGSHMLMRLSYKRRLRLG